MTTRMFIKHRAEPTTYAIEADEGGLILAALDVTDEATTGGLCPHLLGGLPLAGRLDDVEMLNRQREAEFEDYVPECGNLHHLMQDLLALERDHRDAAAAFALADSRAKSLKKDLEMRAAKVHDLLDRINHRTPLPLFEAAGA
jgi:hypothetical protein